MRRTRRRRAASLQSRASATGSSRAGASDGLTPLPAAASDGVCVRRHAHQCADGEPRRDGNDSRRCCHRTRALTLSLDGLAVVRWGDRAARCGGVVAQLLERAAGRGSSSTGFGARGTLGREGRRAAARTAPARAMLPATRRLPCRLCTNAPVAAALRLFARPESACGRLCATTSAPPTELRAASTASWDRPGGRSAPSWLRYSEEAMLPITATPRAAPKRRVASFTAEPTPAFSTETAPMIASVAGAVIRPRPPPPMIICPTSTMYGLEADTVEIHHSASPNIARPVATTALLPILTASLVPTTAATAMDIATGSIRSPVSNAL